MSLFLVCPAQMNASFFVGIMLLDLLQQYSIILHYKNNPKFMVFFGCVRPEIVCFLRAPCIGFSFEAPFEYTCQLSLEWCQYRDVCLSCHVTNPCFCHQISILDHIRTKVDEMFLIILESLYPTEHHWKNGVKKTQWLVLCGNFSHFLTELGFKAP